MGYAARQNRQAQLAKAGKLKPVVREVESPLRRLRQRALNERLEAMRRVAEHSRRK